MIVILTLPCFPRTAKAIMDNFKGIDHSRGKYQHYGKLKLNLKIRLFGVPKGIRDTNAERKFCDSSELDSAFEPQLLMRNKIRNRL